MDDQPLLAPEGPGIAPGSILPSQAGEDNILVQIQAAVRPTGVSRVELRHRSHDDSVQPTPYEFVRVDAGELELRTGQHPLILYPERVAKFAFHEPTRVLSIWTA